MVYMKIEFITKDDLEAAVQKIIAEFKECLLKNNAHDEGYRTKEARNALRCSAGKLKSLRIAGKLRCKKIGGTVYYNKDDIQKLLKEGFQ